MTHTHTHTHTRTHARTQTHTHTYTHTHTHTNTHALTRTHPPLATSMAQYERWARLWPSMSSSTGCFRGWAASCTSPPPCIRPWHVTTVKPWYYKENSEQHLCRFRGELLRAPALSPALDHGMSLQSSLGITKKTQNSTHAAFAVELLCAPAHTAQTRGVQK